MYNLRQPYPNELYHHGIKGQKWGVRRFQNPDGSYTAAGKKRYGKPSGERSSGTKDGASPLMLLISPEWYFADVLAESLGRNVAAAKSRSLQKKCDSERAEATVDPKSGLKIQSTTKVLKDNLARVNPAYKEETNKPTSTARAGGVTNNCVNCSVTTELRRRGFEVQAKMHVDGRSTMDVGKDIFKGAKKKSVESVPKYNKDDQDAVIQWFADAERKRKKGNKELLSKINDAMSKEEVGSRGLVSVKWDMSSGHALAYEILPNGALRILDGQTNTIYDGKKTKSILKNALSFEYMRVDNCEIDYKKAKEAVR